MMLALKDLLEVEIDMEVRIVVWWDLFTEDKLGKVYDALNEMNCLVGVFNYDHQTCASCGINDPGDDHFRTVEGYSWCVETEDEDFQPANPGGDFYFYVKTVKQLYDVLLEVFPVMKRLHDHAEIRVVCEKCSTMKGEIFIDKKTIGMEEFQKIREHIGECK